MGITRQAVDKIESGESKNLSAPNAIAAARLFKISVEELVLGEQAEIRPLPQWDADTIELASWFQRLLGPERQRLRTLLIASRFAFDRRRVSVKLPYGQKDRRVMTETDTFAGKPPPTADDL